METKKISSDQSQGLAPLIDIVRTLRGENGCPWDKKQTPETMWKCLIEEVYELLGAIESGNMDDICDEMGDVLFQLVFISELYQEKNAFGIPEIVKRSSDKMIRRHPHVYEEQVLKNEQELFSCWETIKNQEKKEAGKEKQASVLDAVPSGMPALIRSYKISERAVRAGFDWQNIDEVMKKAEEEWVEFGQALQGGNEKEIATEFGDILFTLTNVARFAKIHPETALAGSTEKFEKRYRYMERQLAERGFDLKDVPRQELEILWDRAKEKYDCHC